MGWLRRRLQVGGVGVLFALGLAVGPTLAAGAFVEPEAVVLLTISGEESGDSFGWVAENLGDINGDGINDMITSAPNGAPAGSFTGKVYVYSGSDGSLLNAVVGSQPGQRFGYSASRAGDVNADGVPDYVAGGPGGTGRVMVFSGADHKVLHEWSGTPGSGFGAAATSAGDIDGDGYGDLIVGSTRDHTGGELAGRVYVYSGRDGSVIWQRDGIPGARLGTAVGLVGDVNGDGVPDLSVGAGGGGRKGGGEAYVFSGQDGSLIHTLRPVGIPNTFGVFFASGAGDVNADGVPDIYVGDYNALRGAGDLDDGLGTGRAYVFSGRDGSRLHVINADHQNDGVGPGRGVGDVNGDGYADLIVAAYTSSAGAPFGGKAYVVSGYDGSVLRTITSAVAGELLGVDALGFGDVNGDGVTDYIITGFGTTVGHVYVVAGSF